MKLSIIVTTLLLSIAANANECIPHKDLKEISDHFSQFEKFVGNKAEYCQADLGDQWFKIGKALTLLKNITPNEPAVDQADAFSYKAITEKNWWAYFTNRADRFSIKNNCQNGVVAYVQPFWGGGKINLCPFFFDFNTSSQASTMMHEVRHFDGHSHTTCTQGNENGIFGACDGRITSQGSYAISVQTLVGMARSNEIPTEEKGLVEAEAIYMAFNKFNQVPQVKINSSLVLSNGVGEVYQWDLGQKSKLITTLTNPSKVLASGSYMTIYPIDRNLEAYRSGIDLKGQIDNPGLFAVKYNEDSIQERNKYQSVAYLGNGGILKDNTLYVVCDRRNGKMSEINLDNQGQFSRILTMGKNASGQEFQNYLMSESGELLSYECANFTSTKVNFTAANKNLGNGLLDITQMASSGSRHFAIKENGQLTNVETLGNKLEMSTLAELPADLENQDWISIAPLTRPEVF